MIRCGSCKDRHETVAQVQACYGTKTPPPATERQLTFIATLRSERNMPVYAGPAYTRAGASTAIDSLLAIPKPSRAAQPVPATRRAKTYPDVPQGYYATDSLTGAQDTDFWFVKRPKDGRWAGRTFVKRYLGGQGPIDTPRSAAFPALEAIVAAGIDKAGNRFSDELGNCRDCGRDLTDQLSRQLRRGPTCRSK